MEILPQLIRVEPTVSSVPLVHEVSSERSFAQYMADAEPSESTLQEKTSRSEAPEKVASAQPVEEQTTEASRGDIPAKQEIPLEAESPDDPIPTKLEVPQVLVKESEIPRQAVEPEIDTDALAHLLADMKHLSTEEVRELPSSLEIQNTEKLSKGDSQEVLEEAAKEAVVHDESPKRKLEGSEKRSSHQEHKTGDRLVQSEQKAEKTRDALRDSRGGDKEKDVPPAADLANVARSSSEKTDSTHVVNAAAVSATATDPTKTEEAPRKDGEPGKKVTGIPPLGSEDSGTLGETAQAVSSIREAGTSGRRAEETRSPQTGVREITVELRQDGAPQEVTPGNDAIATPTSFRETAPPATAVPLEQLARRLNGDLGESVVRQAQILMSEGDKAEIRLIIRPPELGRVRIQLQMEQGHIAGRILVDNANVRQMVEQNLAALQRAFAEAGLEMGQLDVRSGDSQEHAGQQQNADNSRSNGRKVAQLEQSVRTVAELDYGHRHINLVA